MTSDLTFDEPQTNPHADEDPITEVPDGGDPADTPPDNPSGSAHEVNELQGDDVGSGGS